MPITHTLTSTYSKWGASDFTGIPTAALPGVLATNLALAARHGQSVEFMLDGEPANCRHCGTALSPAAIVHLDDLLWYWRTPAEWRWYCNTDCLDAAAEAAAMRMGV
jgi:hypothetical protein